MDGMEDGAPMMFFLGNVLPKQNVVANDGYGNYHDDSLATCEILDYTGPAFLWMTTMITILRDFNHIKKCFKNWQGNTSDVGLSLHSEPMPEERIMGVKNWP